MKHLILDKQTIKDIEKGLYKDCYLIYNRKSTDDAKHQKNSIKYQKKENQKMSKAARLPVASVTLKGFCTSGIISERHSGFKEDDELIITKDGKVQLTVDRPKFLQLVQFVSLGYFKGIICLSWERISRNKSDDTIIRKLMRKGVDIRFAYASYDKTSAGELHMDVDGMFAQHHSRVTSEKVTIATRNARERGLCTYRAPIGYLNTGKMDHKPLDPDRSPTIKRMFELYATGEWNFSDLERLAKAEGLVTPPMRRRRTQEEILENEEDEDDEGKDINMLPKICRPITANHINRILTNPFYTGKVLDANDVYVPSTSHEALIDEKLFNTVQKVLKKKQVSVHYTDTLDLPLRGAIRCSLCSRVYTPYVKKGIQYYNSRCTKSCANTFKNFNFNYITGEIGKLISNLYFTKEQLAELGARTGTDISLLEEKRHRELEQLQRQKKQIREDLKYLRGNRIQLLRSGVYTPEGYREEEYELSNNLADLVDKEDISDKAMHEVAKDVHKLSELLKNGSGYYLNAKPAVKERIIRMMFSELLVSQNTLEYKVTNGFKPFETRFDAICDPIAWLSELSIYRDEIKDCIYELEAVISP